MVLFKGKHAFVILNRFPYITGHLMVVPYRHVASPLKLKPEEWAYSSALVRPVVEAIEKVYKPQGFNIGMNIGQCAGAGIHEHIHIHVVPRWSADTNFIPVLAETRVIPEALEDTYRKLLPFFESLAEGLK